MRKIKLISVIILVMIISDLVFAGNTLKKDVDNLATIMIEKLNADVILTDSQKVIMHAKAKEFISAMQNSNKNTDKENKSSAKKEAYQKYKASLDSLLTDEQKTQLQKKRSEQKAADIRK